MRGFGGGNWDGDGVLVMVMETTTLLLSLFGKEED